MKTKIMISCDGDVEVNDCQFKREPSSGTIPFTLQNMVDLLTVYNAYLKLEDALRAITEIDSSGGLLWGMRKLDDLIQDLSPVFNPDLDHDEQEYSKIIRNRKLSIHEKARLLMGD